MLTILSSVPNSRFGPLPFFQADKVVHFLLFAIGAVLLTSALRFTSGLRDLRLGIFTLVIMIGVGVVDEIHQLYTPGRSGGDLGDLTADALGSALGIFLILLVYGKRLSSRLGASRPDRAA